MPHVPLGAALLEAAGMMDGFSWTEATDPVIVKDQAGTKFEAA